MPSRSQKTRFVKAILQGQIRGQMTGNRPEEKLTNRFAIFWSQNIAYLNGQPQPENQICQGHPLRSNPRSNDWEQARGKTYKPICDLFPPKDNLPKCLAAARKRDLSRSSFKVKSEVKWRGTGQKKKFPTDLRSLVPKYSLPKWLATARKPDLSRSSFKVKSEVKWLGTGQRKNLQTDLRHFCSKR